MMMIFIGQERIAETPEVYLMRRVRDEASAGDEYLLPYPIGFSTSSQRSKHELSR